MRPLERVTLDLSPGDPPEHHGPPWWADLLEGVPIICRVEVFRQGPANCFLRAVTLRDGHRQTGLHHTGGE